jgi:pimeloyl-ACP methyl ester carboxylesterase
MDDTGAQQHAIEISRRSVLKGAGTLLATLGAASLSGARAVHADDGEQGDGERRGGSKPRLVLVHGAWADGTGWQEIIPLLEAEGYPVIATQNPLTSIADDVAKTKLVIDAESQHGPVVVVGHSYGGVTISGAAAGNPNVKALVYLAAFAPDANEIAAAFLEQYPSLLGTALVPDAAGYLYVDRSKFREVFAGDVSRTKARVMAATQKPVNSHIFGESLDAADNTINPDLQRFYAQRMGATTSEIDASHVAFISRPREVVRFIKRAARAVS